MTILNKNICTFFEVTVIKETEISSSMYIIIIRRSHFGASKDDPYVYYECNHWESRLK